MQQALLCRLRRLDALLGDTNHSQVATLKRDGSLKSKSTDTVPVFGFSGKSQRVAPFLRPTGTTSHAVPFSLSKTDSFIQKRSGMPVAANSMEHNTASTASTAAFSRVSVVVPQHVDVSDVTSSCSSSDDEQDGANPVSGQLNTSSKVLVQCCYVCVGGWGINIATRLLLDHCIDVYAACSCELLIDIFCFSDGGRLCCRA
jgi:hypothetical protein